jgi:4-amino-4-deoxy-L-arabinose transferase-like glycosyltransferase
MGSESAVKCPTAVAEASLKQTLEPQVAGVSQAGHPQRSTWVKQDLLLLGLLVLLSLVLRIGWAVRRDVVVENEGAEYVRIAVNLADGHGYVGTMSGPQLLFPPLYPILIRTGFFLTDSPVTSARAVSILAGTLLVPLLFLIVSTIYGRRPAWIAAIIAALYPFLIGFSAATYSESLYTTLLAGVVYFAIAGLRLPPMHVFVALGSLLGLAYLTRPEIMGQIAVLALIICAAAAWKRRLSYGISGIAIALACCAVFASPYVVYLGRHTHHFRIEGKSEVNYALISRINSGMDPDTASGGLSATGEEEGPLLNPNSFIGKSIIPHSVRKIAHFFSTAASRNARGLYDELLPGYFWLPLLTLCLFGLFRSAWSAERTLVEILLLTMFVLAAVPVLIAPFLSWRFVLPMMPFIIIWAAKGIDELGEWIRQSLENLLPSGRIGFPAQLATVVVLSAIVLVTGVKTTRGVYDLKGAYASSLYLKDAGLALANRARGKTVVDDGTVLPFYSGATWMPLPTAPPPILLRYFEEHHPNFVVINNTKPAEHALSEAIKAWPNAHALSLNLKSPLTIYEWDEPAKGNPAP